MRRVGFRSQVSADPVEVFSRKSLRVLRARSLDFASAEEMSSQVYDLLVYLGYEGASHRWRECVCRLPTAVVSDLLAYARSHPQPRLFAPLPTPGSDMEAKERAALAAQAELIRVLQKHLSGPS